MSFLEFLWIYYQVLAGLSFLWCMMKLSIFIGEHMTGIGPYSDPLLVRESPFSTTTSVSLHADEPVTIGIPAKHFMQAYFVSNNKIACSVNAPSGYPTTLRSWPATGSANTVPPSEHHTITVYITTRQRNAKIDLAPVLDLESGLPTNASEDTVFLTFQPSGRATNVATPPYTHNAVTKAGWVQHRPMSAGPVSVRSS